MVDIVLLDGASWHYLFGIASARYKNRTQHSQFRDLKYQKLLNFRDNLTYTIAAG